MSSVEESSSPQGTASWPHLAHNGVTNNTVVAPQPEDGRRSSWSGSQQGMAPESRPDSFSARRSLIEIFSSLGKGGRYARRQKAMASGKTLHRMEGPRPSSQFYVDLPKDSTADSPLPEDADALRPHTHGETPETPSEPVREQQQQQKQQQKQQQQQEQQQQQHKKQHLTPQYHPWRPPPGRSSGTPVRGVLVLPEAARESSAYRVRARLFCGDPDYRSPPTRPRDSMGAAASTVLMEEPREAVAPFVVQQYGSMLAELTQRHGARPLTLDQNIDPGSLAGHTDYSDSGEEEEEKEEVHEAEAEASDGTVPHSGDEGPSVAPAGDSSTSSMTPKVLCETNQLTPNSTDLTPNSTDLTHNSTDLTPAPSPELTSQEKRDRKIFLIAQEVMTSERVFVDVLRLLNVDFRKFVCEWGEGGDEPQDARHAPVLPLHELDKILNYLPQLQNLNEEILSDLEVRIADWDKRRKISDVIVRKGPFLKLYSAYIREFQSQSDHLDHCCQTYPAFAHALKAFEMTERCTKLNLKHYMLKPVQRIPQYRLLLEEYLKFLPENSPDYVDTQTALAIVANVAAHANDTMKQGTNFVKLLALQGRLSSGGGGGGGGDHEGSGSRGSRYELLRPGRYLLKEGELLKLCRREMQPRYYILLTDVLLYTSFATSNPAGALRLNYELPLEGMRVETPRAEDFKNEFSVISTSRSFTLQASSAKERDEWLRALREAITDNASRRSTFMQAKLSEVHTPASFTLGKQAPVWIPDYRVTMCQQCTAAFTLTFRRHHCRACGKVVCDHCSSNRAPLQYKKNQTARVCDACFEVLQQDFEVKTRGIKQRENQQQQHTDQLQEEDGHMGRQVDNLKAQFRRGGKYKTKKKVPERLLEVSASDASSQMSGYLRMLVRRSWRRGWFVLKDRVLYEYRAPQDVCALYSLPVLGYQVDPINKDKEVSEDFDDCLAFQLSHPNQEPLLFETDSPHLAEKWIQAVKEAVVLS